MSSTLAERTLPCTSVNSQIAGFYTLDMAGMTGMRLLFHIGSRPDGVFGIQLLKLLEKDISELVRVFFIESVHQFLSLVFPKLVTQIVKFIAAQEVLLLDLLQCNV